MGKIAKMMLAVMVVLVMMCGCMVAGCAPAKPKVPVLHVQGGNTTYDMSSVPVGEDEGGSLGVHFTIVNKGRAPLTLDVTEGDANSRSTLGKDILKPGEGTSLEIDVDVPQEIGPFESRIVVASNDPNCPRKTFVIKGRREYKGCAVPAKMEVRNVEPQGQTKKLAIYGMEDEPDFRVVDVTSENKRVTVRPLGEVKVRENRRRGFQYEVLVKYSGKGNWEDNILVKTSSERCPLVKVPVKVSELLPYVSEPGLVLFVSKEKDKSRQGRSSRDVLVTSRYAAFKVKGIAAPSYLEVKCDDGQENMATHKVLVRLKSFDDAPAGNSQVTILGDAGQSIVVPVWVEK